jgi:hypothetical protein
MAHTQDSVPSRDAEFDGWLKNLTSYVNIKTSSGAWTHIPPAKVTALTGIARTGTRLTPRRWERIPLWIPKEKESIFEDKYISA